MENVIRLFEGAAPGSEELDLREENIEETVSERPRFTMDRTL